MSVNYQIRYAGHPADVKSYDTQRLRDEFLVQDMFKPESIELVYSYYDRFIVGGAMPVSKKITLDTIDPLKAPYFLERRELGIINIGGKAIITVDGKSYDLDRKEALYVGKGNKEVIFASADPSTPAKLYLNSAPAHKEYPTKHVTLADAIVQDMGSAATSNERRINKLLVNGVVETCQLQMGMTELKDTIGQQVMAALMTEFQTGSVWNTMPAHTHTRRMEAYFYFDLPDDQAVAHFMGEPRETRHIWMHNEQAVISPNWSIHAGAGTAKYTFIWGMAGENLDYTDMDICQPFDLL